MEDASQQQALARYRRQLLMRQELDVKFRACKSLSDIKIIIIIIELVMMNIYIYKVNVNHVKIYSFTFLFLFHFFSLSVSVRISLFILPVWSLILKALLSTENILQVKISTNSSSSSMINQKKPLKHSRV